MPDPNPLTPQQQAELYEAIRAAQQRGYGEVRLVIDHGIVCFLQEIKSIDIRVDKWLARDRLEKKT
jgi:hypothetical protein